MNLASIQKYRGGLAPPTNPFTAVLDVAIPLAGVIGKRLEEDQSVTPAERAALVKYQRQVKLQKYLKDKEAADIKGGKTVEFLDRAARDLVGLPPLHEHQYADLAKTDLVADYDPSQDEYVKSLTNDKLYQKRIMAQKRSQEARLGKGKPPIVIPMKEFVAEHKKLIPILKKGTKAEQVKEALDQEAELKMKGKGKSKKGKPMKGGSFYGYGEKYNMLYVFNLFGVTNNDILQDMSPLCSSEFMTNDERYIYFRQYDGKIWRLYKDHFHPDDLRDIMFRFTQISTEERELEGGGTKPRPKGGKYPEKLIDKEERKKENILVNNGFLQDPYIQEQIALGTIFPFQGVIQAGQFSLYIQTPSGRKRYIVVENNVNQAQMENSIEIHFLRMIY